MFYHTKLGQDANWESKVFGGRSLIFLLVSAIGLPWSALVAYVCAIWFGLFRLLHIIGFWCTVHVDTFCLDVTLIGFFFLSRYLLVDYYDGPESLVFILEANGFGNAQHTTRLPKCKGVWYYLVFLVTGWHPARGFTCWEEIYIKHNLHIIIQTVTHSNTSILLMKESGVRNSPLQVCSINIRLGPFFKNFFQRLYAYIIDESTSHCSSVSETERWQLT